MFFGTAGALRGKRAFSPVTFAMRQRYSPQSEFEVTPIEHIVLPRNSRDELPPILAGLQWIWTQRKLKAEILELLETKILAGKKATGRTGMDLWQILVLGVVRLGLDADYDRLEHVANYDTLVRQMLGVPATPWGAEPRVFGHQTLRDNVALLDEALLKEINARVAAAGREVFRPKKAGAPAAALEIKVDTYVLETDVHFPTDLNLLWDAGRKCVELIVKYRDRLGYALPGWRKAKDWRRRLKSVERIRAARRLGAEAPRKRNAWSAPRATTCASAASSTPKSRRACSSCAPSRWSCHTGKYSPTSSACSPSTSTW
jgi:hypothetical protein